MQDYRIETGTEMVLGPKWVDPVVLSDPGPAAAGAMVRQAWTGTPGQSPAGERVVRSFRVAGGRNDIPAERHGPARPGPEARAGRSIGPTVAESSRSFAASGTLPAWVRNHVRRPHRARVLT